MLPDPRLFASEKYPIRASSLPALAQCTGTVMLSSAYWAYEEGGDPEEGVGSEATETGSLVHAAADVFHKLQAESAQKRLEVGLDILEAAREKFPKGNVKRARSVFTAYAQDKENIEANVVKCEAKITFALPCAPFDPTGLPVYFRGTLDQIRQDENGQWTVWDIKTGATYYGRKALDHYILQQAAYVLGAEQHYKHPVHPGGLICTKGYEEKSQVFFFHFWSREEAESILWPIISNVAVARMGKIPLVSGDACKWCEHKKLEKCRQIASISSLL